MITDRMTGASQASLIALIYLFAVLMLLPLIANPGYWSHDELQKYDYLITNGFMDYLNQHLRIHPGKSFAAPVRPIPFFFQGVLSFFLRDYPVLVHLFAVVVHATVASLLFVVCKRFDLTARVSLLAALVFLANPMTLLATGWSAALMDQWYLLFGLLLLLEADKFWTLEKGGWKHLALIFLFSCAAILSKETAIVLPALLAIPLLLGRVRLRDLRYWIAISACVLPILTFVLFRATAILTSFDSANTGRYAPELENISDNILVYFLYPFQPVLYEAGSWTRLSTWSLALACSAHVLLVLLLWRTFGLKAVLVYLAAYFAFLIPVLTIDIKGSHYLYASAVPLSIAVAALWASRRSWFSSLATAALAMLLVAHSALFQFKIYDTGMCMNRIMYSTEAVYLSIGSPQSIEFRSEPGAPSHVLRRFIAHRNQIGSFKPVELEFAQWKKPRSESIPTLSMNKNCVMSLLP